MSREKAGDICKNCRYWFSESPEAEGARGECRRKSPDPGWFFTSATDWCGSFGEVRSKAVADHGTDNQSHFGHLSPE